MKLIHTSLVAFLSIAILSCQNQTKQQTVKADSALFKASTAVPDKDPRPVAEVDFLTKVKAESDNDITSNAIKKDTHIEAFNKYALDSLKTIVKWKMIVTDINDDPSSSNSVFKVLGGGGDIYNLILTAPIKIDPSVDSVAMDNRVDFTYTIPKKPNNDKFKSQLEIIKKLNKGDVIVVSGSLTHLDDSGKVNFAPYYNSYQPWNVDLLVTDIAKSAINDYKNIVKY